MSPPRSAGNNSDGPLKQRTIEDAISEGGGLCFYDDFLLSGVQAGTALRIMMGDGPVDADPVARKLPEDLRAELLNRPVNFRFASGLDAGVAAFEVVVREYFAPGTYTIGYMLSAETSQFLTYGEAAPLVEFLHRVGEDLLLTTKAVSNPDKWTSDLCRERALGYGSGPLLVSTFYNVPTSSVTALWASGKYRGIPWIPLLPRRQ